MRFLVSILIMFFCVSLYAETGKAVVEKKEVKKIEKKVEKKTEKKEVKKITLSKFNSLAFHDFVTWDSAAQIVQKALELQKNLRADEEIYLIIDSGGGGISSGLEMIDNLKGLKIKINVIPLYAASMAFQLVQSLNKRYMTNTGTLMSHKAWGGFFGEFPGQLDNRFNFWKRRVEKMEREVVARTNGKFTLDTYQELIENEYWCDGNDCVDNNFADEVVLVTCDASLSEPITTYKSFRFWGMKIEITITKSACPLITGYLDFQVEYNVGTDVFGEEKERKIDTLRKNPLIQKVIDAYRTRQPFNKLDKEVQQIILNN